MSGLAGLGRQRRAASSSGEGTHSELDQERRSEGVRPVGRVPDARVTRSVRHCLGVGGLRSGLMMLGVTVVGGRPALEPCVQALLHRKYLCVLQWRSGNIIRPDLIGKLLVSCGPGRLGQ